MEQNESTDNQPKKFERSQVRYMFSLDNDGKQWKEYYDFVRRCCNFGLSKAALVNSSISYLLQGVTTGKIAPEDILVAGIKSPHISKRSKAKRHKLINEFQDIGVNSSSAPRP